jgi:tRNA (guanine37-N1)-methyltransferase
MMRIDILTLFPEMMEFMLSQSIIGRAIKNDILEINYHNIRDYTDDKHRRIDDYPYGGGKGMVMQAEPIYNCYKSITQTFEKKPKVIFMSPQGRPLDQKTANDLAKESSLMVICGHYEGIDERVLELIVDQEISIGDYVLTGGELPALVLCDVVCRLVPGVLKDSECYIEESHQNGLLEYPQYTRPEEFMGLKVPEVLLSGHHANIEKWRLEQSIVRTKNKRPDMYLRYIEKNK